MLRPQSLPIKVLGVGAQCFAANIPAGAIREHTEKFSLAWVVAVHATVPFFAFMRKGVGMPKWAIVLTLASAVAGQAIGARLERYRWADTTSEGDKLHSVFLRLSYWQMAMWVKKTLVDCYSHVN